MKSIVIVDWKWSGHHPMYFRKLLLGFRQCGARILAICPEEAIPEMEEWTQAQPDSLKMCEFVTFLPAVWERELSLIPNSLRDSLKAMRLFGLLSYQIWRWERRTGHEVGLVFFATIYDWTFRNFQHTHLVFRYPWSGIYLHARSFRMPGVQLPNRNQLPRPEDIFTAPSMSSICVLDEGAVAPMQELCKGKPVFEFPDITDTDTEDDCDRPTLAEKILRFANGRKIVVCIGHLQKTKGLLELCLAARDERLQDVCFFFGGEVSWWGMSRDEIRTITGTWEQAPNVITHLARITSDATINTIIRASDVVFAAYTNFPNSSNMMTKAAYFERPIIVSDGFLMAERVMKHQTGKIVPEGDDLSIVSAILELTGGAMVQSSGFRDYYSKHSNKLLHRVLDKVINTACN